MPNYIIRAIDRDLWRAASDKAHAGGCNLKTIIERLLREWLTKDAK